MFSAKKSNRFLIMNETIEKFLAEQSVDPSADFTNRVCAAISAERAIDEFLEAQPVPATEKASDNILAFPQKHSFKKRIISLTSLVAAIVAGTLVCFNVSQDIDRQIDRVIAVDCNDDLEILAEISGLLETIDTETLEILAYND